jgi:CDP-glucose 4,6-dehydratase
LFYLQWGPVLTFDDMARFTGEWYDTYYHKKTDNLFEYTTKQIEEYVEKAKQKKLTWTA